VLDPKALITASITASHATLPLLGGLSCPSDCLLGTVAGGGGTAPLPLAGASAFGLVSSSVVNLFTSRSPRPSRALQAASVLACALASLLAGVLVAPRPAAADPATAAGPGSLAAARAQAGAVNARLSALDAQMARLGEQLDQAQNRADALQSQVTAARAAVDAAQAQVGAKRDALKTEAVDAYIQGGSLSGLVQIMEGTQQQAALRQGYLSNVSDAQQNDIDGLHAALLQLDQKEATLAQQQAAADSAVAQVRSARDGSARAAAEAQSELAQANGQVAQQLALIQQQQAGSYAGRYGVTSTWSADQLPPPSGPAASVAVQWAQRELGKPYEYGAAGPDSFDCSGLTMFVYARAGVSLPHSAAGQWDDTTRVPVSELQPGDLVFYYTPVDHVGIYVGNGQMIVADHTGTVVSYASIYRDGLDGGGRVG